MTTIQPVERKINLKKAPYVGAIHAKEVTQLQNIAQLAGTRLIGVGGYPLFNGFDHTTIDLTDLRSGTPNWGHTLSVKLPNNQQVTLSIMQTSPEEQCIDIQFYDNGVKNDDLRALGFSPKANHNFKGVPLVTVINKTGGVR